MSNSPPILRRGKQFHGDREAASKGEILSAMTSLKGSAGFVAIQPVAETVQERKGFFLLQHNGTKARGAQQLSISVAPDLGTEDLVGLSGTMSIRMEKGGKHFYDFEYELPAG